MTDRKIKLTDEMIVSAMLEQKEQIRDAHSFCKVKTYLFEDNLDQIIAFHITKNFIHNEEDYFSSVDMKKIIEKNKNLLEKIIAGPI
tara:strand:+ start:3240 stop:3500 length:261 start_codon:yes stop_codon:yes gene_type:complete